MYLNLKRVGFGILLLAIISAGPALAGKNKVPEITSVFVVSGDPDTLLIMGANLEFGKRGADHDSDSGSDSDSDGDGDCSPEVTLGNLGALAIVSATATELVVELPVGLPDGDYLLTFSNCKRQITYDLTIGAVGPSGPPGPEGPPGEQGEAGPPGEPGLSGYEIVTRSLEVPAGEWFGVGDPEEAVGARVDCPTGKKVLGGGFYVNDGSAVGNIRGSGPFDQDTWTVQARNDTVVDGLRVTIYAVCASTD